jgi:hypothetical protein
MNRFRSVSRPVQRLLTRRQLGRAAPRAWRFQTTKAPSASGTAAASATLDSKDKDEELNASASQPNEHPATVEASEPIDANAESIDATDGSVAVNEPSSDVKAEADAAGGEEQDVPDQAKAEPEIEDEEKVVGARAKASFQAETAQLLDIVAHSLYTDKEVCCSW